jgi:hypothetical protein
LFEAAKIIPEEFSVSRNWQKPLGSVLQIPIMIV